MSRYGNVVQTTVDTFGRDARFTKKSGSWYRRQSETIAVVNLQKSQYGFQYHINVALWLRSIGDDLYPKEHKCHVRTRLGQVFPDSDERLKQLLDLEVWIDDQARRDELLGLLTQLLPVFDVCETIVGLASPEGQRLTKVSLVTALAWQHIVSATSQD